MELWHHIRSLQGSSLATLDKKEGFVVQSVQEKFVRLQPKRGYSRTIERDELERAWHQLRSAKRLTIAEMRQDKAWQRHSPYIAAILSTLPHVGYSLGPIELIYREP